MSLATREYLMVVVESAFGTPKASPVKGTDSIFVRLDEGNAFSMEPNPLTVEINHGGGYAVKQDTVSSKTELKGSLKLKLCYSQAKILLGLALTKINAGQTSPWTTTEAKDDLASVSIYHAVFQDDTGTFLRQKYVGVKCTGGKLDVSEDSQVMALSLDLQGSKYFPNEFGDATAITTTEFPVPLETDYANDYVTFSHSDGGMFVGDLVVARAYYWTLGLSWTNKVEATYFAKRFAPRIRCYGREVALDSELMLVSSPNDLATFRQLGGLAAKTVFTNGTNTLTFDFKSSNRIKGLPYDTTLDRTYRRKFSLENRFDPTAGVDFSLAVA